MSKPAAPKPAMPKLDPNVDAYIAKSAEFARPILVHLRKIVHANCPQVEETLKWGMPAFMYHGILCGMAAFKQHCAFNFWKAALIVDGMPMAAESSMGQFGRITKLSDLPPPKVFAGYLKKAMALNEAGTKQAKPKAAPKPPLAVPADLTKALKADRKADATFVGLSPSHRREYVEWITEAKTPATRERRLATTLQWLAQGKSRNWKYLNC